jgi:hypothetical protein
VPTQQAVRTKRQGRTVVTYRDAKGKTRNGIVRAVAPRPGTPVLQAPAGAITGGTLAAGTFWYRVSATSAVGQGLACAEQSGVVASGSTGSVALTWAAVPNATSYSIYGRTQGAELLMANQAGTTFTDNGSVTPSGALPTQATTPGNVTVDTNATNTAPQGGFTSIPQASAMRGSATRYFMRFGNPAGYPQPNRS